MLCRIATPTRISLFIRVRYLQTATPTRNKKLWDSVDDAVKDVKSGDVLLCGGQYPRNLIMQSLSNTLFFAQVLDSPEFQVVSQGNARSIYLTLIYFNRHSLRRTRQTQGSSQQINRRIQQRWRRRQRTR